MYAAAGDKVHTAYCKTLYFPKGNAEKNISDKGNSVGEGCV